MEAARDLGASRGQAFFTVTLKLTLPGLLSGVILTFVPSMGLFFIADILGGNKIVLVGSLIQDQMTQGKQAGLLQQRCSGDDGSYNCYDHDLQESFQCQRTGGNRDKKSTKFEHFYMGLIFFLMYLPIAVVVIFSFNESRLPVKLTGFSLKWYQELIHDSAMLEALVNSLVLGALSCLVSAGVGTLGAVGLSRIHWKSKRCAGIYFHTSTYDPRENL